MAVRAPYFRLLGSFRLTCDQVQVSVGGPVAQALLAVLAYPPDTKLLPDQLIAAVWGVSNAVTTDNLYHFITRLRRALAPIGLDIVGHRPGYRLPVNADQVDAARFDELVRTARALRDTDPDEAVHRLREALALWQGSRAMDNLILPGIRRIADGLDARRLDAEEELAELDLHRGQPDQVLDRLRALTATHPARPRLTAALVRALHATGRTDQARTVLVDAEHTAGRNGEAVHPALAHARAVLSGSGTAVQRCSSPADVPFQLPADTLHFTGRVEQLGRLLDLWPDGDAGPRTVVVSAIEGMAGVGKTALAVHAAHRLADRFADGVLFVDLRGFTPGADPMPPEQALDYLLRGLGVPGDRIPPDLDARSALYRTLLARRRVLIVLDNAADESQVEPLLPSGTGCLVLITSRRHLAAVDDATHITALPGLDPGDAAALFRALARDRVTAAEQRTVDQIVALCGYLPLAIRIAAARLRFAQASTPARLYAELTDASGARRLDWLSDGHRAVTAALAASYHHLTPDQQHAFRLIGLHPGTWVEPYALAALADTSVDHAQRLLSDLQGASLLDQSSYRRYTLHDLIATWAATLADDEAEPIRNAALDRLLDHYAHVGALAIDLVYPHDAGQRPRPSATPNPVPSLNSRGDAQAWLDNELDNLVAAALHAAGRGRPDHTIRQSATLRSYLRARGRYSDAIAVHQQAMGVAREAGDRDAERTALRDLGHIYRLQGRYELAADCYQRALTIAGETGDRNGEHTALHGLGHVHYMQDRYNSAADCYQQALTIARETGDRNGEHDALRGIGHVHVKRGRYQDATRCYQRALTIARETRDRNGEQFALRGLAHVLYLRGDHLQAAGYSQQVLAIARETGDTGGQLFALRSLGHVHRSEGRYEPARRCYERVLAIARETGNRNGQFEAHQALGRLCHADRDHQQALEHHRSALELSLGLGQTEDQARAHDGLARVHQAIGDTSQARHHWHAALAILTALGTDQTDEPEVSRGAVAGRLTDLERDLAGPATMTAPTIVAS
jgi:tetratricopeptide (TPR) repeat protein/DNA-binding SARP family transcriptional activator